MPYRLPPLHSLRLFEAAGRYLSFKQAAAELHVTPSAVSHGIRNLEDWLGVQLFLRGHGALELTTAGKAYLPRVQAALDLLAQATEAVPGRRPSGRLSLSVAPSFAVRWLIPRLVEFDRRHPDIEVTLDSLQRQVDFPRDGVDLAIRMGHGDWPGLAAVKLIGERLVPVCAPRLAPEINDPAALASQTLLRVSSVAEDWAAWAARAKFEGLNLERGLSFDNIDMALEAAAEGLGIALGRHPLVDDDLASGRLTAVLGPPQPASTAYWLLAAPDSLSRPEILAFRDWICGALGVDPAPSFVQQPA